MVRKKELTPSAVPEQPRMFSDLISEQMPESTKSEAGKGAERLGPEDVYFTSDEQKLERLLREHGHDPLDPLAFLLSAIIKAHPDDKRNDQQRLEIAIETLIGKRRARGRDHFDDYDVLLEIAWEVHLRRFGGEKNPELAPIIQAVLERRGMLPRAKDSIPSVVSRYRKKFKKDEDVLLARVTSEMDPDRMDMLRDISAVAERLERLGVKLDRSVIRARLRSRAEPNPGNNSLDADHQA